MNNRVHYLFSSIQMTAWQTDLPNMHAAEIIFTFNSWSISQSTTSTYRFWVRGIRWWVGPRGSQNHGLNFPAQLSCWEINVFDFFLKMTKIFIDWRADVWIGFSQLLSIVHEQTIYHLKDLGARISGMVLILLSVDSVLRICKKGDFIVKLRAPMKPRGDFAEKRLIFSVASFSTIYVSLADLFCLKLKIFAICISTSTSTKDEFDSEKWLSPRIVVNVKDA